MSFDNGEVKIGNYAIFITYCDWLIKKQNGSFFVNHCTHWLFNKPLYSGYLINTHYCNFYGLNAVFLFFTTDKEVLEVVKHEKQFLMLCHWLLNFCIIYKLPGTYCRLVIFLYFKLFFLRIKNFLYVSLLIGTSIQMNFKF